MCSYVSVSADPVMSLVPTSTGRASRFEGRKFGQAPVRHAGHVSRPPQRDAKGPMRGSLRVYAAYRRPLFIDPCCE